MRQFAEWLSHTSPSVYIQTHNAWMIPAIQSIHIVAIGLLIGSVFMIDLRILGWAGTDQSLRQTADRFGPWLTAALFLLLATGTLLVVGEPVRELISFSFWLKMSLVALSTSVVILFRSGISKNERIWEDVLLRRRSIHWLAILTFVIWMCVIVLGRLIAYDHVWGSWSPAGKA